jgi:5-formyltetrahydrofolate cyclo-ligase
MGASSEDTKARLRRGYLARSRAMVPEALARVSAAACAHVVGTRAFRDARHIVVYAARLWELDAHPIAAAAARNGVPTYYPRLAGGTLEFVRAGRADLAPGALGIEEPAQDAPRLPVGLDGVLFVVPGVAFDRQGGRLGSGLGCYDRALAAFPHAIRNGLARHELLVDRLPTDPWDLPVDAVATERGVFVADSTVGAHAGDLP